MVGYKWLPFIDRSRCNGCGLCAEVCNPKCLKLRGDVVELVAPDRCGSEEHCILVCAQNAISMDWATMTGDMQTGQWHTSTFVCE